MAAEASAIVTLVELGYKILAGGYVYVSKAFHASKEVRSLLEEVAATNAVFVVLLEHYPDADKSSAAISPKHLALKRLSEVGTLASCMELLKRTETAIKSYELKEGKTLKNVRLRIIWALLATEKEKLVQGLRKVRNSINSAVNLDSAAAIDRIEANQSELERMIQKIQVQVEGKVQETVAKASGPLMKAITQRDHQELISWLIQDAASQEISPKIPLVPETGRWLFLTNDCIDWMDQGSALLWIYGIPGCGKTSLCKAMIEHIRSNHRSQGIAVLSFFHDRSSEKGRSLSHLLATITNQLLRANDDCLEDAVESFASRRRDGSSKPKNEDLIDLIRSMSARFNRLYLVVDALDEAQDIPELLKCLVELKSMPRERREIWKLFLTSRNDFIIQNKLQELSVEGLALHEHNHEEVESYVSAELERRTAAGTFKVRDDSLRLEVERKLKENAKGLFLQAKLQIDRFTNRKTDGAIRRELSLLPSGLYPTYDQMLKQIARDPPETIGLVHGVLKCVSVAVNAGIELEELSHAVAALISEGDFDEDNIADGRELVDECGSFVLVTGAETVFAAVQLAHSSVLDYLQSSHVQEEEEASSFFYLDIASAHLEMALACIKYLSYEPLIRFARDSHGWRDFSERYPFYNYAERHWHKHLNLSGIDYDSFSTKVQPRLQWFLNPEKGERGPFWLWRATVESRHKEQILPPFYYSIRFGILHAFTYFSLFTGSPDEQFVNGEYPLTFAASCDQLDIVQKLLDCGAKVEIAGPDGLTALHFAARNMNDRMVECILSTKNPVVDSRSQSGLTPLHEAAKSNSVQIMAMLKDWGADINAKAIDNSTPILEAVIQRASRAMETLIHWGADPSIPTTDGVTTMSYALWHGTEQEVSALGQAYESRTLPIPTKANTKPLPMATLTNRYGPGAIAEARKTLLPAFAGIVGQNRDMFLDSLKRVLGRNLDSWPYNVTDDSNPDEQGGEWDDVEDDEGETENI